MLSQTVKGAQTFALQIGGVLLMRKFLTIAAICALALPAPTPAQDYGLGGMDAYISTSNSNMITTNTIISNAAFRASLKKKLRIRDAQAAAPTRQSKKSAADVLAPVASLNFAASPSISKRSMEQFLEKMRGTDPQGARALQQRNSKTDFFVSLGAELNQYGMRTDNVGDAMTVWLINLWMGANGITDDPPVSQIKAVRMQVSESLRSSETITKASDAQKQELAEGLWLNAALVGSALADPRVKSGEMRGQLQTAMSQVGRNMGMDLTAMQISDAGFSG